MLKLLRRIFLLHELNQITRMDTIPPQLIREIRKKLVYV